MLVCVGLSWLSQENSNIVVGMKINELSVMLFSLQECRLKHKRTNQLKPSWRADFTFVGQGFIVLGQGSFILGQGFMILERRWDGRVDFMILEQVFMIMKHRSNILKQTEIFIGLFCLFVSHILQSL